MDGYHWEDPYWNQPTYADVVRHHPKPQRQPRYHDEDPGQWDHHLHPQQDEYDDWQTQRWEKRKKQRTVRPAVIPLMDIEIIPEVIYRMERKHWPSIRSEQESGRPSTRQQRRPTIPQPLPVRQIAIDKPKRQTQPELLHHTEEDRSTNPDFRSLVKLLNQLVRLINCQQNWDADIPKTLKQSLTTFRDSIHLPAADNVFITELRTTSNHFQLRLHDIIQENVCRLIENTINHAKTLNQTDIRFIWDVVGRQLQRRQRRIPMTTVLQAQRLYNQPNLPTNRHIVTAEVHREQMDTIPARPTSPAPTIRPIVTSQSIPSPTHHSSTSESIVIQPKRKRSKSETSLDTITKIPHTEISPTNLIILQDSSHSSTHTSPHSDTPVPLTQRNSSPNVFSTPSTLPMPPPHELERDLLEEDASLPTRQSPVIVRTHFSQWKTDKPATGQRTLVITDSNGRNWINTPDDWTVYSFSGASLSNITNLLNNIEDAQSWTNIIICIGVNDIYSSCDIGTFYRRITALYDSLRSIHKNATFVIPPYSGPHYPKHILDRFSALDGYIREIFDPLHVIRNQKIHFAPLDDTNKHYTRSVAQKIIDNIVHTLSFL